jgi:hypothetical protein
MTAPLPLTAGYAYSNGGHTMRTFDEAASLQPHEVAFADIATHAQLEAAFPGYDARVMAERVAAAKAQVDAAAEDARLRFLTPGSAQAMVYGQKEAEARALMAVIAAGTSIDPATYPHLSAEVGVTASSLEAVAAVVLAMAQQWLQISAMIEGRRLAAKVSIGAARDLGAIDAILGGLKWPAP